MPTTTQAAIDMASAQATLRRLYADQRRAKDINVPALHASIAVAISVHHHLERLCGFVLCQARAANDSALTAA